MSRPRLRRNRAELWVAGIRVDTEKNLEPSFKEAFASKQPVVIDVACGSDTAFPDFP